MRKAFMIFALVGALSTVGFPLSSLPLSEANAADSLAQSDSGMNESLNLVAQASASTDEGVPFTAWLAVGLGLLVVLSGVMNAYWKSPQDHFLGYLARLSEGPRADKLFLPVNLSVTETRQGAHTVATADESITAYLRTVNLRQVSLVTDCSVPRGSIVHLALTGGSGANNLILPLDGEVTASAPFGKSDQWFLTGLRLRLDDDGDSARLGHFIESLHSRPRTSAAI